MRLQRREFLAASIAAAALLASKARAETQDAKSAIKPADKKLKILVLGGTGFLGPAIVEAAQARGHTLTLFNRGKTNPGLFPDVEKLHGDRDPQKGEGLKALEGRKWDVVFDDCGYYPRMVKASAELMAPNVGHYVYVSSISCYAKEDIEGLDESAELATMEDPTLETMGPGYKYYGALKALCEKAAQAAFKDRATIVRPGYIVGPGDPTGRFTYWPARFDKGGDVLVPGATSDPVQVIDVRDLGQWMVRMAETKTFGAFNACGPEKRLAWGELIEACMKASSAKEMRVHWAGAEQLDKHKDDEPFKSVGFEIWAPYAAGSKGSHTWSNARALKSGLTFRPIETIVKDTLAWWTKLGDDDRGKKLAGPSAEQEAAMLKALT